MPIHEYPYTDFHEMNLDWIIRKMKELIAEWTSFGKDVTASAHESASPEVNVTGDLKTELNFDFGLVKGDQGEQGPEGAQGKGLEILGVYATLTDLQTAHPTGDPGDVYLVGSGGSFDIYVWNEDTSDWEDGGPITSPSPSSTTPLMDSIGDAGTSLNYSRADHVHPSDTSKQDTLVSGVNIKTINGTTLLGADDIGLQVPLISGTNIKTINNGTLLGSGDISLQEPLVSGTNIKTINNTSVLGAGNISVQDTLVSGTNIKTVNNTSLLGSGDVSIGLNVDELWTNATPTADFAAQTLSIDFTGYDVVIVECRERASSTRSISFVVPMETPNNPFYMYGFRDISDMHLVARPGVLSPSDISFSAGHDYNVSTEAYAENNSRLVPVKIYGLK